MKKLVFLLMACFLFLSGCTAKKNIKTGMSKAKQEEYESYYNAVADNSVFAGSSDNYDVSFEMNQVPDGSYRYYMIVDNARTAMYDVVILAVENDMPYKNSDKMMPSSGVFEDPVSLIPGQVNKKEGYVKGIVVSGETDQAEVNLKILVEWNNRDDTEKSREFLSFRVTPDGASHLN